MLPRIQAILRSSRLLKHVNCIDMLVNEEKFKVITIIRVRLREINIKVRIIIS